MTLKELEIAFLKVYLAVALVMTGVLLTAIFKTKRADPKIEQLDQVIRLQQEKIEVLEQLNAARDSAITDIEKRLGERAKVQTKVIHHYEQIPIDVDAYDRERLRREVTNY